MIGDLNGHRQLSSNWLKLSQFETMYSRETKISVSVLVLEDHNYGAIILVSQNTY